jgi:hypothetical protein
VALGNIRKEHDLSPEAEIGTLEDGVHLKVQHILTEGDWIIRGVQGGFLCCSFAFSKATYEKVE